MQFKVYYRIFGGIDAIIKYKNLTVMQNDLASAIKSEFEYINACMVCEDGSEEIVYSSYKEIMEAERDWQVVRTK